MIMDALEEVIKNNPQAKFIYTVPNFQNPTGKTMSLERRERMVELSEQSGIPIFEDDPYAHIRFSDVGLPAIKSFDRSGMVAYLGSFSKIVAPSLRLGWICANKELLHKFCKMKEASDLQASTITQYQLVKYLEMYDLNLHIRKLTAVYRGKRNAAIAALDATMPDDVTYTRPQGGFFSWLTIPGVDTTEMFTRSCQEFKVAYVPGASAFANDGGSDTIRLSYSQMNAEKIAEGVKRLAKLITLVRGG